MARSKWLDVIWGKSPERKQERVLLAKIDWFILSYCCLMVSSSDFFIHIELYQSAAVFLQL